VLLLPKLRSQFAEFLHESYLEPLRLLASHTSVSLWYGHHWAMCHGTFLVGLAVTAYQFSHRLHSCLGLSPFSPDVNAVCTWRCQLMASPVLATRVIPCFNAFWWCRNINRLSIGYASRPRLRSRLTLGGVTWPRKPYAYGERASHSLYRYSCPHNHLHRPPPVLSNRLVSPVERSPTQRRTRRRVSDTSSA